MEQQSPTPERPDDVKPSDAVTPPVPPAPPLGADAPAAPEAAEPPAPPLTPMGWLQQNSPFLVAFIGICAALVYYLGLDGLVRAAEVVVGLGFVIFIHELGHFVAAKWCNVHVQTFSLGFGPALPGCSFTYGETTYKIGILPLGGFVQMVGEGADADEDENYPRSYKNKTVLQRMVIISAGVVMNVLFGCVCFAVVYEFYGVRMPPAVVWRVDAGSPAWKAGVPTGAAFTQIGSTRKPTFEDLKVSVALQSLWTGVVHMEYEARDGAVRQVDLRPRAGANDSQPVIGVGPPGKLQLCTQKMADGSPRPAFDHSPAAAARVMDLHPGDVVTAASDPSKKDDEVVALKNDPKTGTFDAAELSRRMRDLHDRDMVLSVLRAGAPADTEPEKVVVPAKGFEFDDLIAATTDPEDPDHLFKVKELAAKVGGEAGKDFDFFDYQERMKRLSGKPIIVQVLRVVKGPNDATTSARVNILTPPAFHRRLGLKMKMGEVAAIRGQSPASDKVMEGDRILGVRVKVGDQTLLDLTEDKLDPVRLPFDLEKKTEGVADKSTIRVELTVNRWENHEQKPVTLTLNWDDRWRFDEELPIGESSAMALAELGIAYRVESTVVHLDAESPAAKAVVQVNGQATPFPIEENDRIEKISFKKRDKNGPGKWMPWDEEIKSNRSKAGGATEYSFDQWAYYFAAMQTVDSPDMRVRVWRNGTQLPQEIEMTAEEDTSWPLEDRGLLLLSDWTLQKADNPLQAVGLGMGRTTAFIEQLYLGFANILTGRISFTKHAEGPLRLAQDTFEAAQEVNTLILWLGMISVNLAVVNFLPIPVLDGGHMVFLVYELIRRKPPSDTVRAGATYVGLTLLGLLMLFVFYLDAVHIWHSLWAQ